MRVHGASLSASGKGNLSHPASRKATMLTLCQLYWHQQKQFRSTQNAWRALLHKTQLIHHQFLPTPTECQNSQTSAFASGIGVTTVFPILDMYGFPCCPCTLR